MTKWHIWRVLHALDYHKMYEGYGNQFCGICGKEDHEL